MSRISASAGQHAGEELVFERFPLSTIVEDSAGTNGTLFRISGFIRIQRSVHNALTTLLVFAAVVFLLLSMYLCGFGNSYESGVRGRFRRLAGKEGDEGKKDARSRAEEACEMVEEAVSFREAAHTASSGPSPTASEAVSEEKRPRKRKKKASWFEREKALAPQASENAGEGKSFIMTR